MNRSVPFQQKNPFFPVLIFILLCVVLAAAAWTATSSPALSLSSPATPTHARSFSFAEIAKATYTALPTTTPTRLPTASPTSESQVQAEIVGGEPIVRNPSEVTSPSYSGNKRIVVDISEQHMYVYEGDNLVNSFVSSTGMGNSTRVGTFSVLEKIPNAYGATWDIWMPDWLGIYWSGNLQNGIHALPILPSGATLWEGYLGTPISFGCVVLGTSEAQILYDWADVGTPVDIQW